MRGRLIRVADSPWWKCRCRPYQTGGGQFLHLLYRLAGFGQLLQLVGSSSQKLQSPDHGNSSTNIADVHATLVLYSSRLSTQEQQGRVFSSQSCLEICCWQFLLRMDSGVSRPSSLVLLISRGWTCKRPVQPRSCLLELGGLFACSRNVGQLCCLRALHRCVGAGCHKLRSWFQGNPTCTGWETKWEDIYRYWRNICYLFRFIQWSIMNINTEEHKKPRQEASWKQ